MVANDSVKDSLVGSRLTLELARRRRLRAIRYAREAGLTYAEIGSLLGITESGARRILERAKDA